MTRKRVYLVIITVLFSIMMDAQANILNAKSVDQIGKKTTESIAAENDVPLSYGYISNRDILWSKVVWEFIDLNQKINFPYYFPIDTTNTSNGRCSLFDTLVKAIKKGDIENVYSDSFFISKITQEEIDEKLVNIRTSGSYADTFRISTQDIQGYMMKGMWYFDKRKGELKYRPLALAPMGKDVLTLGLPDIEDDELYELFWIFFPEARGVLHKSKVFNPKNNSQPISYDHLLNARRFNSVIVREENIYGNRKISDYIKDNALFQLLEASRIKENIRDREIDMWNY